MKSSVKAGKIVEIEHILEFPSLGFIRVAKYFCELFDNNLDSCQVLYDGTLIFRIFRENIKDDIEMRKAIKRTSQG